MNITKEQVFKVLKLTWRILIAFLIIAIVIGGLFAYFTIKPILDKARATSYSKMSNITDGTFINEHNTQVYDKDNNLIGEININNFEYVNINNISPYIQSGYIAVEDRNFLTHNGIDYKALTRASLSLIKNSGEVTQGGSTITQQVLKNNVLTDLSDWERKTVEFFLAPELEEKYSKNQIMEFYCNTNYYQNGCYGVESASKYYFGKSAKDVTLAEAAGLCGISNNPSKYNPVKHLDAYKERREKVLSDMLECGYINDVQYNEANKDEVNLVLSDKVRTKESYQVSFAIHCATLKEMANNGFDFKYTYKDKNEYTSYKDNYNKVYKETASDIRNGGYKIYTSLDSKVQNSLQGYVDKAMSPYIEKAEDGRYTMQASATVVDNESGYVIAIVGGRGTEDEFNRAYQSFRQPGSCAKPIVAYAPAFDTGYYYPSKQIKDTKSSIAPNNWDNIYRGKVNVREALERSINTPAFYVMQDITPQNAIEYLGKMRFSGLSYLDTHNGSLALGGFTYGTTTFEMSKAYQTLVNNGVYDGKDCITSMLKLDDSGQMVEVYGTPKEVQVYTKDTAYMIIDCLKGVLTKSYATGKAMAIPDVIAAGKTGTTNSNKDGWFCGMTPKYSIAVWAGYDSPKPVADMGGGKYPGEIYKSMMTELMKDYKNLDFTKPSTVELCNINGKGEMVDYTTGSQDLFSMTALKELQLRQKEETEKKKQLEAEKIQKEQDYLSDSLKKEMEEIKKTEIKDLNTYNSVIKNLENIKERVKELKSSITKEELNNLIDLTIQEIETNNSVLKVENDNNIKREEEEQKRKEIERKEELKKKRIEVANTALDNLEKAENKRGLIDVASKAVNSCKSYNEYKDLKSRYDILLLEIRNLEQAKRSQLEQQTEKASQVYQNQQNEQFEHTETSQNS